MQYKVTLVRIQPGRKTCGGVVKREGLVNLFTFKHHIVGKPFVVEAGQGGDISLRLRRR